MRVAILCTTPFQIFNAINMKHTLLPKDIVDIYIADNFKDSERLACVLESKNIFNLVRMIKLKDYYDLQKQNINIQYFVNFYRYLNYKNTVKGRIGSIDVKYDKIFYASRNYILDCIITYFAKINPSIEVLQYEDGLGNYCNIIGNPSILKKTIFRIFGQSSKIYNWTDLYIYEPRLLLSQLRSHQIQILPKLDVANANIRQILNNAFSYNNVSFISKIFIWMEQDWPFDQVVLNELVDTVNMNKILIKPHPRKNTNLAFPNEIEVFFQKNVPWEIVCMNMDINSKVLISGSSASLFTPKTIFDQEPFLVFVYKIFEDIYNQNDMIDGLTENLRALYRNPEKIFIPNNITELVEVLLKLENMLGEVTKKQQDIYKALRVNSPSL